MKVGILGGGQLSRMLALSGIPLGIDFSFYFVKNDSYLSWAELGKVFYGDFEDELTLKKFAESVDVITLENENIPTKTIAFLEKIKPVYPDKNALKISQDRLHEKNLFTKLNIPTNQYVEINSVQDLKKAAEILGFPFVLKKRTLGYDGKGQMRIPHEDFLNKLSAEECHNTLAEAFVPFDREISIIAARSLSDELAFYEINENTHKDGILIRTQNKSQDFIFSTAQHYIQQVIDFLNYRGILTIEFFQVGENLLANEMAPRVHNSGHWTIDGASTSQFENHLRAILNLPLGSTKSLTDCTMMNLLGEMPDKKALLAFPNACLHDYQKKPAAQRKIGHITLLGNENTLALEKHLKLI